MRSPLGLLFNATSPDRVEVQAAPPVPFSGRSASVSSSSGGSMSAELAASSINGTVFSIVNRTSTALSAVEWHLYRKAASRDPADREETQDHPALVVWNNPNSFFTSQEIAEVAGQHLKLTGEWWWVVAYAAGRPVELWPVMPNRIVPVAHPTKFISGYIYFGPDGEKIPLGLNQVIMGRQPDPLSPFRGLSFVRSVMTDIDAAELATIWNRNFFNNSAAPGGVIEIPGQLTDEEFDEFQARWAESHRGVNNAHRVALIEYGGKWAGTNAFSQKDMQISEMRKVVSEVIREAAGIHGHMLGLSENVNRANADAASEDFHRLSTIPDADRMKGALNKDFLPLFGKSMGPDFYEWDYDSPIPEDQATQDASLESRSRSADILIKAGFYAPSVQGSLDLPAELVYGDPSADPKQALLIELVKAAPTLAPTLLPMLGYELPEAPSAPEPAPAVEPAPAETVPA